tara:strand:- start:3683 stop:3916 length:234 start_codon:yes stop_codon:yes gene_type:complete
MDNDEALFLLLKAIREKDIEAAESAICHLRVGIATGKSLPKIDHSASMADSFDRKGVRHRIWMHHSFDFKYMEMINE